jgi:endonuclease-3
MEQSNQFLEGKLKSSKQEITQLHAHLEAVRAESLTDPLTTLAAKGTVPGLERVVPKSKGAEVGSQLHQLGVEMYRSPYGPTIRKLLLEIEPDAKDNLPKRPKPEEAAASVDGAKPAAAAAAPAPSPAKGAEPPAKKTVAKKPAAEPAKPAPGKKQVKKVLKKKVKSATAPAVKKKTTATKRLTKKKPR